MTPEREQLIRDLSAKCDKAKMIYESHAVMNTPTESAKRIAAMQEYHLAWARYAEAERELVAAINGSSSGG